MPDANTLPVLLVGASGRLGRMVSYYWRKTGHHMPLVGQFCRAGLMPSHLIWDPLDGPEALLQAIATKGGFSAMVVLAGVTPGPGRELELNRLLAAACLGAALEAEISRVLLASSSAVYGVGERLAETAPCSPINEHGAAKLRMEQACAPWRKRGLEVCFLRLGNVAGADALLLNVAKAAPDQPIEIDTFEDGHGPVRSYIGAHTLTKVVQSLFEHRGALPEILNIGAPDPISMDALADAAHHPWRARAANGPTPQRITIDCSKLASLYKFSTLDSDPKDMVRQWKECSSR